MTSEKRSRFIQFLWGSALAIVFIAGFVIWAETDPRSLVRACLEDGPIEYISALLFGLTSLGFVIFMGRSRFLRRRTEWWRYVFVICWALLMFVFMGEEVSWGQRIFDYETPASVRDSNVQGEFNIHNYQYVEHQKYRLLSIMMWVTGFLLPVVALAGRGRRLFQKLAFPVLPIGYMLLFVGGWIFGKYYYNILMYDASSEVREILMAIGLFCFALHGVIRPRDLFRLGPESG